MGYLKAAAGLPMLEALTNELQNFRYQITTAGNTTFAPWREAAHDDLILSLAISLHYAEKLHRPLHFWSISTGPRLESAGLSALFGGPSGRHRRRW